MKVTLGCQELTTAFQWAGPWWLRAEEESATEERLLPGLRGREPSSAGSEPGVLRPGALGWQSEGCCWRLATTLLETLSSVGRTTASQRDGQARQGKDGENGPRPLVGGLWATLLTFSALFPWGAFQCP